MQSVTEKAYETAVALAGDVEDNFLELAKALRQLSERDPDLLSKAIQKSKLGRRKAYYLIGISKNLDHLRLSKARLRKLGWTKLGVISGRINDTNAEEMLDVAERHTVKQLEQMMRGETPPANSRCVLLYFTPAQYEEFETALLQNGAKKSGRGLLEKEQSVLRALRSLGKTG